MFGGRVPTDPGNFVERAMLKNTPPERRDARDWPAIEALGARGGRAGRRARARAGALTAHGPSGSRTASIAARRWRAMPGQTAELLGQQVRRAAQRAGGAQLELEPEARDRGRRSTARARATATSRR